MALETRHSRLCDGDMDACFNAFDKDGDGLLSITEFELICRALFRNDRGKIYGLEEDQLREVYSIFDLKGDGMIDREEFEVACFRILSLVLFNTIFIKQSRNIYILSIYIYI